MLPLLRVTLGAILIPHGCQKLFGWFGGMGFARFAALFDKHRLQARRVLGGGGRADRDWSAG